MPSGEDKDRIVELGVALADDLVEIYEATITVLYEGIRAGQTNAALGLMSLLAYTDLLHGGAYKVRTEQLPFYNEALISPVTKNLPAAIEGQEAMINSNVPHVFPKLLSDQTYYLIKERIQQFSNVVLAQGLSTSVSTFVEGGAELTRGLTPLLAGRQGRPTE